MIWLVLLDALLNHRRVFVEQRNQSFLWSGVVHWVTPWTLALCVSYEDNESTHLVFIPIGEITGLRDFSPSACREILVDAYGDDPPSGVIK